jgi:hypothetical protein
MLHRIDQTKLDDSGVSKTAILTAVTRLTQIETATTATTTQVRQAVQDMAKYMKHIIKVLTVLLLITTPCHAAFNVGVKWDANTESDLKEYRVCWGNYSGNAKKFTFVNCSTVRPLATSKVVNGLSDLQKWYFRVNASNDYMTSDWSNMVYVGKIKTPTALKFQSLEIR